VLSSQFPIIGDLALTKARDRVISPSSLKRTPANASRPVDDGGEVDQDDAEPAGIVAWPTRRVLGTKRQEALGALCERVGAPAFRRVHESRPRCLMKLK
jgi:hypothetical protein